MEDEEKKSRTSSPEKELQEPRRSGRDRTLSEKGLKYELSTKGGFLEKTASSLTQKSKKIQDLIADKADLFTIKLKFEVWKELHQVFADTCYEYESLLPKDQVPDERLRWLADVEDVFGTFFKDTTAWVSKQEANPTPIHPQEDVGPEDSVSQVGTPKPSVVGSQSGVSHHTSHSALSATKLADEREKAELLARSAKLKKKQEIERAKYKLQLQEHRERQEMERQRQEMERAMARHELQLKEEQHELDTKIAVADARARSLNKFFGDEFEDDIAINIKTEPLEDKSIVSRTKPRKTTTPVRVYKKETPTIERENDSEADDLEEEVSVAASRISTRSSGSNMSKTTRDSAQWAMIRAIKKMSTVIKKFDGNIMEYRSFIDEFETKLVPTAEDDKDKLTLLRQFTEGTAHEIVQGYAGIDASEAYQGAMEELEERYGDPHKIANAYLRKVLDWPPIKPDNVASLDKFAIFLNRCKTATRCVDGLEILEHSENMKRIVKKLPYFIQDSWSKRTAKIRKAKKRVRFEDLVDLVKSEASRLSCPDYSRQAMASLDNPVKKKKGTDKVEQSFATSVTSTDKKTNQGSKKSNTSTSKPHKAQQKPCLHCQDNNHSFDSCEQLIAASQEDTVNFLRNQGVCFGCLKPGHRSRQCKQKAKCSKCQGKHPTVLHQDRRPTTDKDEDSKRPVQTESVAVHCTTAEVDQVQSFMGTGGQDDDTGGDDDHCKVLLTIIPVKVKLKGSNRMVQTYAFLDTGSVISFCTEALQRKLGATGRKTKLTVNTVNGLGSHTCDKVTGIEVYNLDCSEPQVELKTVYTKPEIGVSEDYIPRQEDLMRWPHLKNIRLPRIDAEIGLMIGTGETAVFTPLETIRGPDSTPHACRTRVGWIPWHVVRLNEQGNILPATEQKLWP
ncbi:uncharacterized protein [Ptychodera flava]|uniref:uncharacterized protein n=1 Tax=Ptychodera flava TaxID=63121 RepID=UPI00396A3BF3